MVVRKQQLYSYFLTKTNILQINYDTIVIFIHQLIGHSSIYKFKQNKQTKPKNRIIIIIPKYKCVNAQYVNAGGALGVTPAASDVHNFGYVSAAGSVNQIKYKHLMMSVAHAVKQWALDKYAFVLGISVARLNGLKRTRLKSQNTAPHTNSEQRGKILIFDTSLIPKYILFGTTESFLTSLLRPISAFKLMNMLKYYFGPIICFFQIIIIMQEKHKKHIASYFNENYIKTVSNFEKTVLWLNDITVKTNVSVARLGNQSPSSKALNELQHGHNNRVQTKVVALRIVSSKKKYFVLITDDPLPKYGFQYGCLIVEANIRLLDQIVPGKQMIIKEPYLASEFGQFIQVLVTREDNISIGGDKFYVNPKQAKQAGNQLFKSHAFYQALYTYQLGLMSLTNINQFRERAILYSNSVACLYEISLHEAALEYANTAIRIDNTYPKSYVRKINCLLELKYFSQIPKSLLNVYHRVDGTEIDRLNKKYTNFVENNCGVYDWVQIFKKNTQHKAKQFGSYFSQKILVQKRENEYPSLIARQEIARSELIVVGKPLIYFRASNNFLKQFIKNSQQISQYINLQRSFYMDLKSIPCSCHAEGPIKQDQPLNQQELLKKLERSLFMERYVEQLNGQIGYGVWKDMLLFKQECQPNCTFVHLKTAFVANACRDIKKGESLTVDFFAQTQALKRKQIIKDKFGSTCLCLSCVDKKWPSKYFGNIQGLYNIVESMPTNKLKKEMIWHVLCQRKYYGQFSIDNHYSETVQKYLSYVNSGIAWEDILNILKISRGETNPQIYARLHCTLLNGFTSFLSMDKQNAEKLIKLLQTV